MFDTQVYMSLYTYTYIAEIIVYNTVYTERTNAKSFQNNPTLNIGTDLENQFFDL